MRAQFTITAAKLSKLNAFCHVPMLATRCPKGRWWTCANLKASERISKILLANAQSPARGKAAEKSTTYPICTSISRWSEKVPSYLKRALSISACPIARLGNDSVDPFAGVSPPSGTLLLSPSLVIFEDGVEGGCGDSVDNVVVDFSPPAAIGVCAWVGLSAPYMLKLSVASFHCSTT